MKRLSSFVVGILVGAALMFMALKYHVVRAPDGWHMIPKASGQLSDCYVDIRAFDAQTWADHKELAADIMLAKKQYLISEAVVDDAQRSIRDELRQWTTRTDSD